MAPQIGRRLRKGATTTAVAAAAVAALSASQGPGVLANGPAGEHAAASGTPTPPPGAPASGNSPYYTDLPPLVSPNPPTPPATGSPVLGADEQGIPATILDAYKRAEAELARDRASCHLSWEMLAAIGKVESGHATGGRVNADGTTLSPILGPVLNGAGFANITDTDSGVYDGDSVHDRAVGPMQFIPSTWASSGRDGNGDGRKDPNNIYDASLATAYYLCGNGDLAIQSHLDKAILSYNHSNAYLSTVMSWFDYYKHGTHEIPNGTGVLPGTRSDTPARRPARTVPAQVPHPTTSTPTPGPKPTPSRPSPTPTHPKPSKPTPSEPGSPRPMPSKHASTFEDAGTAAMTATAGSSFEARPTVRVKDQLGRTMGKATVRFQVSGTTDARFPDGATQVTVTTGADGRATAPELRAGEQSGTFTVRATVVGTSLPELTWTATVNARQADALARTDTKVLTAAPGAEFADYVEVKATYKGAVVPGIAVAAAMIVTPEAPAGGTAASETKVNDKGPYFKDEKGNPLRSLKDLKTDAKGVLRLPKIYADGQTGTFVLRLTTPGGGAVDIQLKVA